MGKKMTSEAAARIQSAEAKQSDGKVEKGGFATRAQRAAAKNKKQNPNNSGKNMSKLISPALIVVGLFFLLLAYVSWDDVEAEIGLHAYTMPQWWQFWIPHSFNAVIVPDYAITYIVTGTAALTAGTTLTIQETRKTHKHTATTQTLNEK